MKNLKWLFLMAFAIILCAPGCYIDIDDDESFFDCIDPSNNITSQSIDLQRISKLALNMDAQVFLRQGSSQSIIVEGPDNVIEDLRLNVSNNEWEIETQHCGTGGELDFFITLEDIDALEVNGTGKITGENDFFMNNIDLEVNGSGEIDIAVDVQRLNAEISGTGDLELEGVCDDFEIEINGTGELDAFDFECEEIDIEMNGAGDARVRANEFLKVEISGTGTVYYKGSPTLDIDITGSGSVVDAN